MTNETDIQGNLLPDEKRLTRFGKWLRGSSLDELPEAVNILKGEMSLIGPRPQLIKDLVFMNDKERMRHTAKPGLSGLAQISGRNAIGWEKKLELDLDYINNICFLEDARIVFRTVRNVFLRGNLDEEKAGETEIVEDYGDYLLSNGVISEDYYQKRVTIAKEILEDIK